jgi:transmembrane sensor
VARAALARRPRKRLAIAAGVLLLAGGPLAAWSIQRWSPHLAEPVFTQSSRTGIGEQADVALPDGSRVTLDTGSRLSVRYEGDRRSVAIEGQGWFDIRPGAGPFTISAGGRTLTAEAGRFDVRTDPGSLRALAVEGGLSIDGATVPAGQRLIAKGDAAVLDRPRDAAALTGWREGLVQFQDVPLVEAVGELNRYRHRPIRIADDRAAALKISGSFRTTEGPAFVDALVSGFPVRVKRDSPDGIVIGSR